MEDLLAADRLRAAFHALARGKAAADRVEHRALRFDHDTSWLRARAPQEATPTHVDWYYWKLQTDMFTVPPSLQKKPLKNPACCDCLGFVQIEDPNDWKRCCECYHYFHRSCPNRSGAAPGAHVRAPSSPLLHSFFNGDDLLYCRGCAVRPVLGTCWVPLGDVPVDDGVLAILPGTSTLPNYGVNTKEKKNVQLPDSFTAKNGANVKGLPWKTADFHAGDVVIFSSQVAHCSSKNYGKGMRLSADFRWYLLPVRTTDAGDEEAAWRRKEQGEKDEDNDDSKDDSTADEVDDDDDDDDDDDGCYAEGSGNCHRRYVFQHASLF